MADKYIEHFKTTSNRYYNNINTVKPKSKRSKYSNQKHSQEPKTPPLPASTSTLDDLMKQRESLKNELKKIVKSNSDPSKPRKRKHSNVDDTSQIKAKVTKSHGKRTVRRKPVTVSSPELESAQVNSEDEEVIIQQQRQKRKQLLEKLIVVDGKKCAGNEVPKISNIIKDKKTDDSIKISKMNTVSVQHKGTDMFSEKDEFENKRSIDTVTQNNEENPHLLDNWDDNEGYYNVKVGDVLNNRYTIKGLLGQGVFANVVRVQDNTEGNDYVAVKIVRNNDLMYRTSLKEISILQEIGTYDPDNKYHCVKYLGHFMHRNHLCILLESLHMDLRGVIKKYGKNHGISLKALISYSRQLILALKLLKKIGIIHADIKPDNILVNEKKNILKVCDFGSAAKLDDNEPTPYLVSRFYRAPEIILGVPYRHGVDVWSAGCTVYEMATGRIMFPGSSNNKMLKCFMDVKGKFSSRFIRKGKFKDQHFNYNNNFLFHKKDEFTGREKVVEIGNIVATRDIHYEIRKSYKNTSTYDDKKLNQLKDLIEKMIMIDPSQRLPVTDCLKHPFVSEECLTHKK